MTLDKIKDRCKALIVDDSFLMRTAIRKILEQDAHIVEIQEAQDGEDALEKVKSTDYDIIFLDIEMPKMDGIEFLKRSKLYTDAIIVIISSLARVNSPQVERAVCFGAYDVVAKPTGVMSLGFENDKKNEILDIVNRSLTAV